MAKVIRILVASVHGCHGYHILRLILDNTGTWSMPTIEVTLYGTIFLVSVIISIILAVFENLAPIAQKT